MVLVPLGLLLAQAVALQSVNRSLLLSSEHKRMYIFEGDLVSDQPPRTAQEKARTAKAIWSICRYWTGLTVETHLDLDARKCPVIGG